MGWQENLMRGSEGSYPMHKGEDGGLEIWLGDPTARSPRAPRRGESMPITRGAHIAMLALLESEQFGGEERHRQVLLAELRDYIASGEAGPQWAELLVQAEAANIDSSNS